MTRLSRSYMTGEGTGQLLYETIGECFDRVVRRFPDHPALGVEPGDRVGIWGPNSYEWILTQFATAKIGAILVNVNPAYRLFELEYVLNKVECKVLISAEQFKSSEYLRMLGTLAPEIASCEPGYLRARKLPSLTTVVRMGTERSSGMFNFDRARYARAATRS